MSSVKSNYIYNMIYRLSICVLPLVITPYIARTLGAEGTGLYSFSSVVACYFIMFCKLGLETYGNRTIAACLDDERKRAKVFWSIFAMQILTSIVSIVVYWALALTVFKKDLIIYEFQFLYVLSAMFDVSWYFYGTEQFKLTTIRSVVIRVIIIVFVFLFVKTENDLPAYTFIMSMAFLLEQLLLLPFVLKIPFVKIKWEDVKVHIAPNLKLFIPLAALSIYNWMDKLMLGFLTDNSEVAYYTYAENIINLPKGIVIALGTVMLPRIVKMIAGDNTDEYSNTLTKSFTFISFLSCALCFGIAGVSPVFVPFFLGDGFFPTINLTIGLAIVMIPMSLTDVMQTQYLVPFKKDRIYIISVLLGAGVNTALNALLIPFFNGVGAVIGTLGAEFTVCAIQMFSIRKVFPFRKTLHALAPFLICGVVEFFVTYMLRNLPLPAILTLIIQIAVGGVVYLVLVAIFAITVRKDLITLLKEKI